MNSINDFTNLFIDVWSRGIFGINVSEIIIGFIIFLLFYILRSFFARFLIGRLYKIVKKTKTESDDLVIEVIEGPLKFLPVVVGFFIATSFIDFNNDLIGFIEKCFFCSPGQNPRSKFAIIESQELMWYLNIKMAQLEK